MLFPLGQESQCEDISQRVEVSDPEIETEHRNRFWVERPRIRRKTGLQRPCNKSKGQGSETSQCLNDSLFWYLDWYHKVSETDQKLIQETDL